MVMIRTRRQGEEIKEYVYRLIRNKNTRIVWVFDKLRYKGVY